MPLLITVYFMTLLTRGCLSEPVAAFMADRTTVDAGESVQFSDQSENDPDFWNWTFEGGSPSTSSLQDPVVTYSTEGSFSVTLEVRNRRASDVVTLNNYMTVLSTGTDVTFVNNTHTPIDIEVGSVFRTIPSGDSVTFYDLEGNSVDYYAETCQTTSGGGQIGLRLFWDYSIDLPGGAIRRELNIGSDFFFLYITNNGTRTIGPVEVDDGDTEPRVADVSLPNNGSTYRIGYYYAWENTQVRAYHQDNPDSYTYWDHNVHFYFPDVMNQGVTLSNTFKKGSDAEPVEGPVLVRRSTGATSGDTATGIKVPDR